MGSKRVGIVDLGSNTFHLLVCDVEEGKFAEVHRRRQFVALAEGGIEIIKDSAIERATAALQQIAADIAAHEVKNIKIVGTAALRSATNAKVIHTIVKELLQQSIEVIAGSREAELIYKGISLLPGTQTGSHLIMDIGGGSTEFIVVSDGQLLWSQSFNIGVGVLHELFHKQEPMAGSDIRRMNAYLTEVLLPLKIELGQHPVDTIIGASGSFEVLASMQRLPLHTDQLMVFDQSVFSNLEQDVVQSDYEARAQLPGMPSTRVKLIVVAFVLLRHIIDLAKVDTISISPYAIKEGLLSEM